MNILAKQPISVKFPKELITDMDNECEGLGCNRTDFIINAVEEKLQESTDETEDQVIKDTKPQIQANNEVNETEIKKDKPKVIIELDSEPKQTDNSKKPPIQMVQFNGKLLPFTRRYNL